MGSLQKKSGYPTNDTTSEVNERIDGAIDCLEVVAEIIPISKALPTMLTELRKRFKAPGRLDLHELNGLRALLTAVQEVIFLGMHDVVFVPIPESQGQMYDHPHRWFGLHASVAFPDAQSDIADCCRCFSLRLWTASVFHAMNIVQRAIEWLAIDWKVTVPGAVEAATWGAIIDKLSAARQQPNEDQSLTAAEKKREVQFRSTIVTQLGAITEAYRNQIMHARVVYTEEEARHIIDVTKAMMGKLAHRAKPVPTK